MAIQSYTQQLEETQAAISALLAGAQEYTIAGRQFRRAQLADLQRREEWLRPRALREQRGQGGVLIHRVVKVE